MSVDVQAVSEEDHMTADIQSDDNKVSKNVNIDFDS